jgi:peptide-methionine (S)-S-oxide reductase
MFEDLKGVKDVESGYAGGFVENPEYKEVKKGKTGHAEVIKISYDSSIISFKGNYSFKQELLNIFMHAHDPTTYHRQGIDSGSQYRSVVYYQTEEELRTTLILFK